MMKRLSLRWSLPLAMMVIIVPPVIREYAPDLVLMPLRQAPQAETLLIAIRLWRLLAIPVVFYHRSVATQA